MIDFNRFGKIKDVLHHFNRLCCENLGIKYVKLSLAYDITDAEFKTLSEKINKFFGTKKVVIEKNVMPELIGGMKIETKAKVLDMTIKHKLQTFREKLIMDIKNKVTEKEGG
jgi:ATP synthase F1 delta subunit